MPQENYPGDDLGPFFWILPKPGMIPGVANKDMEWTLVYVYPKGHSKHGLTRLLMVTLSGVDQVTNAKLRGTVGLWEPCTPPAFRYPVPEIAP